MFFLVSGLLDRLVYMSAGLALILAFIGVKLVLEFAHHENHAIPEISTAASLAVILIVLAITTLASLHRARRDPGIRAHPGSLRRRAPERGRRAAARAGVPLEDRAQPVDRCGTQRDLERHSGDPDHDCDRDHE